MKASELLDKTVHWCGKMMSEDNGTPSSRRWLAVFVTVCAMAFAAGLLIKHPEMTIDLVKYFGGMTFALIGVTKVTEIAKS